MQTASCEPNGWERRDVRYRWHGTRQPWKRIHAMRVHMASDQGHVHRLSHKVIYAVIAIRSTNEEQRVACIAAHAPGQTPAMLPAFSSSRKPKSTSKTLCLTRLPLTLHLTRCLVRVSPSPSVPGCVIRVHYENNNSASYTEGFCLPHVPYLQKLSATAAWGICCVYIAVEARRVWCPE